MVTQFVLFDGPLMRQLAAFLGALGPGGPWAKATMLIGVVALVTLAGAGGAIAVGQADPLWWAWLHLLDPGSLSGDGSSTATRALGTVVSLVGLVVVGGALITFVEDGARRQLERLFHGTVPSGLARHTVIFGQGRRAGATVAMVQSARPSGSKGVLVAVRDPACLASTRAECGPGADVVVASLKDENDLKRLRIAGCARIVVLDGEGGDAGAALAGILRVAKARHALSRQARDGSADAPPPLRIHVELANTELADALATALDGLRPSVEVESVAVTAASARLALKRRPLDCAPLVPGARVHVVVSGWSPFAEACVWHVLKTAHFGSSQRTRVLLLGESAQAAADRLRGAVRELDQVVDFDIRGFAPSADEWGTSAADVVSVLVCGGEADEALARALRFREDAPPGLRQILVELPDASGHETLLSHLTTLRPDVPLHAVSSHTPLLDLGERLDRVAVRLHAKYREQRQAQGKALRAADGDGYVDPADEPWERLDSLRRSWNRASGDHVDAKLRKVAYACGLAVPTLDSETLSFVVPPALGRAVARLVEEKERIDDAVAQGADPGPIDPLLEELAQMEHERWMAERRLGGWALSPDGVTKDAARKLSPYLVPYSALSQQVKHYDRVAAMEALHDFENDSNAER